MPTPLLYQTWLATATVKGYSFVPSKAAHSVVRAGSLVGRNDGGGASGDSIIHHGAQPKDEPPLLKAQGGLTARKASPLSRREPHAAFPSCGPRFLGQGATWFPTGASPPLPRNTPLAGFFLFSGGIGGYPKGERTLKIRL